MRPQHGRGVLWAIEAVASLATMVFLLASWGFPSNVIAQVKGETQLLAQATPQSPCDETLYLELKKKPLNDMSQREYEYFQQKDKECAEYRRLLLLKGDQPKALPATPQGGVANEPAVQKQGLGAGAIIAISILCTIGVLLVLGALASSGS